MFRRRKAEKMLSAEELKTKLYSHLDKTGSINRMRIEIREKLMSELLKKTTIINTGNVSNPVYTFDQTVLPLQISNWLVYDHLLRQGYQYALSIFVTEANFPTQPQKLLAACDILILLGLDSTSPEYKSISQMCSTTNAQLTHSLLVAVIKCLFDLTTKEGRILETREQKEVVKEREHTISVQEKNLDSESLEFKEHDSLLNQKKVTADLSLHDQVLLIKEEKEKEVQQLRHKLLQELDRLHSQERKEQLEIEQIRNELQRERDDLFDVKEKIRQKEFLMVKEYENKFEKKTRELQSDFMTKMSAKEKEQEILQQKMLDKDQKLTLLEMNFSNQKESYFSLKGELEDMKQLHATLQTKYSNLLDENTSLLKKFESMSDYAVVKDDLEAKLRESKTMQIEFEAYRKQTEKERDSFRENLQKLETKLRIKESELLEAQKHVNLVRETLHMEEAVWHKERRKLEQEVMTSREMYQTLIQRIEEQKEDIQALHRTIHILHYQLTDKSSRNTARVEPFTASRSLFRETDASNKQPDIFRVNRGNDDSPSKYRQKSLKFIEDAKDRITKLQEQADALQYKSSIVYNSAPKVTTHGTSNPSLFNFTSDQRFQPSTSYGVKPFVSRLPSTNFENLIRNELPTLDLSFPSHIKSQLANAYTNAYKFETHINAAAAEKTSNDSDNSFKYSENANKKSKAYFTLQSDSSSPVKNHQNINTGLFKANWDTEGTKQYDLNMINDSQVLLGKSFLAKSLLSNSKSGYLHSDIQENENSNNPLIKTGSGDDKLTESNEQNTHYSSKDSLHENPTPVLERTISRNLNEDYESKSEAPINPENKSEVSESDVKKSTSSFQHTSSETPIVVDLDAAWKRKSSLKSSVLTSVNKKSLIEMNIAETNSSQLSVNSSNKNNLPEIFKEADSSNRIRHQNMDSPKSYQVSNSEDSKSTENSKLDLNYAMKEQSKESQRSIEELNSAASNLSGKDLQGTNFSHEIGHRNMPHGSGQESNSGVTKFQKTEPLVEKTKDCVLDKEEIVSSRLPKSIDAANEPQDISSNPKSVHEDTLSELSEIHLSCGSEQEQQKEDSDNW